MRISVIIHVRLSEILISIRGTDMSSSKGIASILETLDITIREGVAGNKGSL